MASLIKKLFYTGVGIISTTTEKVQAQIDEMAKRGELNRAEGRKVVDELVDTAETKKENFETKVRNIVTKAVNGLNLPTSRDLKSVVKRIEKLEAKVEKSAKKKATPKATTRRAKTVATKKVTVPAPKAVATPNVEINIKPTTTKAKATKAKKATKVVTPVTESTKKVTDKS